MAEEKADKQMAEEEEIVESEPRIYEVGFHIVPLVGEEGIPAEVGKVRGVIENAGGRVFAEEWPKTITLAYPMRIVIGRDRHVFTTAHFGWIKFEAGSDAAARVKSALDENLNLLRFVVLKTVRDAAPRRRFVPPAQPRPEAAPSAPEAAPQQTLSKEEIDAEIEKLVVE